MSVPSFGKIQIEGLGTERSPIVIKPIKALAMSDYVRRFRGQLCIIKENPAIDWSKGVPPPFFDLIIEEDILYKIIGFRGTDWEWVSRSVNANGRCVLSKIQIVKMAANQLLEYHFDQTLIFDVFGDLLMVELSKAATACLNQRYSPQKSSSADSAERQQKNSVDSLVQSASGQHSLRNRLQVLLAEQTGGKTLSIDQKKEIAILHFLLGGQGETGLVQEREYTLEEANDLVAFGGFTFGKIASVLKSQGLSDQDCIRFLDDVASKKLSEQEATGVIEDCLAWEAVKADSELSKSEFFKRRLAARANAKRGDSKLN